MFDAIQRVLLNLLDLLYLLNLVRSTVVIAGVASGGIQIFLELIGGSLHTLDVVRTL